MVCPNCGTENISDARFCSSCGNPLASLSQELPQISDLAGRGSRLGAYVVDTLIYLVPALVLVRLHPILSAIAFAAIFVYQMYLLSRDGQTLGKKVVGIRIVKVETGLNGGFVTNVLLRGMLNGLLGFIPLYGIVDLLFIFREDRRCIHDHIAGTQVVAAPRPGSVL
ncbi:MAG: hypothetical protein BZY88_00970 [SAR202 cluster bacterium Io17-Chloro-G9]|nr:MAG: hypothetical protein BZY88_00970 [SAR202 cluster bacterium Io17-Chloro-G9]